ncbi:MAG: hypothetical protein AAFV71_14145 [Cyanobacteria bacterium J06633_8]
MAKITISELRPAGADLFDGSESFMHELNDQEVSFVLGGAAAKSDFELEILWTAVCVKW